SIARTKSAKSAAPSKRFSAEQKNGRLIFGSKRKLPPPAFVSSPPKISLPSLPHCSPASQSPFLSSMGHSISPTIRTPASLASALLLSKVPQSPLLTLSAKD